MADENAMARRGRGLEEEYFHRKEKELIEKLQKRRAAEEQRKELAAAVGNPDEDVLQILEELGYTRDTVAVIHLVPLIHVAWVDGTVSEREREMITEAADLRGVTQGSPAYEQLIEWLDNRPSEEFFEQNLQIVRDLLTAAEATDNQSILQQANAVASASGGILGLGNKISDKEQAVLQRLAEALEKK